MVVVYSQNRVPIRLTEERWTHIRERHPEMESQKLRVLETVEAPDSIQEGDFGEVLAIREYRQTPLTNKFLVVAYRETSLEDGFIMTAYFATRPSTRRVTLWKR